MEVTSKYNLDLDDFFRKMSAVSDTYGAIEQKVSGLRKVDPFAQPSTSATNYNKALGQQVQIYQRVQAAQNSLINEQRRLEAQYVDLNKRKLEFLAAGRYGELRTELGKIEAKLRELKSPLVETETVWDRLKAKFSSGLKIPKTDSPSVPADNRDERGRFLPGSGKNTGNPIGGAVAGELESLTGVSLTAAGGVAAVGLAVVKSTKESAAFGKKLSELSSITGTVGKDLEFLADKALEFEDKTGIAGTEIVETFKLVGSIRPELLANKEALAAATEEVVALAQASGLSLPDAATAAIGALNQFGEASDQAARFVNVMAAGAKAGSSEINDTAAALQNSGGAMKAAGVSFEQGNALIQVVAESMIKGAEAGTGLRNVLLKLETQSDKGLRPSVVGLEAALENAAKKFDTTTERTKAFGVENILVADKVLNSRTEIAKLTEEVTGTGVAYEQQRKNLDNLATDLQKAGTATTGFFRDLGQSQDGFIRKVVQGYTYLVQQLTAKTGTLKAFFRGTFESGSFNPIYATQRGFEEAARQSEANDIARRKTAEVSGIKSAATQGVTDDTKALAELYAKQGQTVPKSQRAAAQKVKEQSDQAYTDAVSNHQRLRSEYERGTKDQKAYFDKQFEQSRRQILRTKTAKQTADIEVARLAKADADRAAALQRALGEPATDADKKAGKEREKIAQDTYKLLLSAQDEYVREYQKLEAEFGKDRLENLKRDGDAYIVEKARLDKEEVDAERAHLEKLLQVAASNKTRINKQTGQREIVPDTNVRLSADLETAFADKKKQIDAEADRQLRIGRIRREYELLELGKQSNANELALFDKKWEGILAIEQAGSEKYLKLVAKRDSEREALVYDQIIRDQKAVETILNYQVDLRKKPGNLTGAQFEKKNELDKIANGLFSSESQIAALQAQNNPANNPEIKRLEAYAKALKDKRKEIELLQPANRDIWDLLGISKSFADETERQVFLQSIELVSQAVRQATDAAIQASEARIQVLDNEIQAKEEQIRTEEERSKEGYANNLLLRRKELEDLKRQKAEEEQARRRALATQQALDLASQVSTNAVTVANTVTAISEMFKQYGKIPLVGIFLALGAIATIVATIASVKARAKAMTQLRKGGRIPLTGWTHEQGGHRIEGTDIEVERGEHVTNARSSEKYDEALSHLNDDDPRRAIASLVRQFGFGLPDVIVKQIGQPGFNRPAPTAPALDTSKLERQVADMAGEITELRRDLKNKKERVGLGDGRYIEWNGDSKVIQNS